MPTTLSKEKDKAYGLKCFLHLHMNELVEESKVTTSYMPRAIKHFKELHFGMNSAAGISNEQEQKVVHQEHKH